MYHVSAQGVDERMINVHYYYYWGTADAEIKIVPVENPKLKNVLSSCNARSWSEYIPIHALPTARNFFLVLISTFQGHSTSFIPNLFLHLHCASCN